MLLDQLCVQCGGAEFRRSRVQGLMGRLFSVIVIPYRCSICGWRQTKLRFVPVTLQKTPSAEVLEAPHGGQKPA